MGTRQVDIPTEHMKVLCAANRRRFWNFSFSNCQITNLLTMSNNYSAKNETRP